MINDNKTTTSKFFVYNTKVIGRKSNNNSRLNAKAVVSLKYLSNVWRSLDLSLINCEIGLDLAWSKYCVISQVRRTCRAVDPSAYPVEYEAVTATTQLKI